MNLILATITKIISKSPCISKKGKKYGYDYDLIYTCFGDDFHRKQCWCDIELKEGDNTSFEMYTQYEEGI